LSSVREFAMAAGLNPDDRVGPYSGKTFKATSGCKA